MDRGAWWAAVDGVAKSQTRLKRVSKHTCKLRRLTQKAPELTEGIPKPTLVPPSSTQLNENLRNCSRGALPYIPLKRSLCHDFLSHRGKQAQP